MATTDSNGLVLIDDTDSMQPLHPVLNSITTSVSNAFNKNVRTYNVANIAERTALFNTIGPGTTAKPVRVWRADAPAGRQEEFNVTGSNATGNWHYVTTSQSDTGYEDIPYVSDEFSAQTANQLRYRIYLGEVFIEGGAYRVPGNFVQGLYTEIAILPPHLHKTGPTIRSGAAGQGGRPALWEMSGGGSIKVVSSDPATRWIALNFSYPLP